MTDINLLCIPSIGMSSSKSWALDLAGIELILCFSKWYGAVVLGYSIGNNMDSTLMF